MLIHELLSRSAIRTPDAIALVEPSAGSTSFASLDARASQVANSLVGLGVRRGDRVVIALENGVEMVASYFGAMRAGAVAVPLPPGPRNGRFPRAVRDSSPAAAIVDVATSADDPNAAALRHLCSVLVLRRSDAASSLNPPFFDYAALVNSAPARDPAVRLIDLDLAAIIYTSGSTGEPRGAMLSHLNIASNTESIVTYLRLTSSDRVMCVLPFYYVYGLSLLHTHVQVGGSVVLDNRFAFPNVVLKFMQETRATGFAGVPSTFALLLHKSNLTKMEFPDLRYVTQAGGGLPPARIREWLDRMPRVPFYVMYGATEASARLSYLEPSDLDGKLGSIGRAIPNVEIVVVREDGTIAPPRDLGELVARGSSISSGYWNNEEETRAKFGPLGYRTGDVGYADEEGFLFLVGRTADMIKVGGQRVGAKEIEDVLNEHDSLHEAAVVGVPHPLLGEAPLAFVVTLDGGQPDELALLAYCRSRLSADKVPVAIRSIASLPKTGVGKIDKAALRRAATETGDVTPFTGPPPSV